MSRTIVAWGAGVAAVASFAGKALATPTQEEVFKSIQQNVGQTPDSGLILAVVLGALGILVLVLWMGKREKRKVTPKPLNHQGKLLKEVLKSVPATSSDIKRLKMIAEARSYCSPLTLLLCPSLLKQK